MTPKRFLRLGGGVLMSTGLLGIVGVLGQISPASFFHPPSWINWVHLIFGIVVSAVAASSRARLQAGFALGGALVGTTIGLVGLLFGGRAARRFDIPELADPSDHAAHLLIGLAALWGWLGRRHTERDSTIRG
jgi:hypothetical protein